MQDAAIKVGKFGAVLGIHKGAGSIGLYDGNGQGCALRLNADVDAPL